MRLFSYRVATDNGSAPNPFWGVCTLVICKPAIRRVAGLGDWVVGIGSANAPIGDLSACVVYAMKVTRKLSMAEYDALTLKTHQKKIPSWGTGDARRCMGDSIYDFSSDPPKVREAVHVAKHRERDLSGRYALISDHFIYFGDKALRLPDALQPIASCRRGHRSDANAPYAKRFEQWIAAKMKGRKKIVGQPSSQLFQELASTTQSRRRRTHLPECAAGLPPCRG